MGYNVNSYDTDFIDLGGIIIDANNLEAAKLIKDNSGNEMYCILFFKNGHSHSVYADQYRKLQEFCRN